MIINYGYIDWAISHYVKEGYRYIDVPWFASREKILITSPPQARLFETYAGCLVASGEQSLLDIHETLEPDKRYVCATPCFRDEENPDELHLLSFFKVELMVYQPKSAEYHLVRMMEEAEGFFNSICRYITTQIVKMVPTESGIDLCLGGIEVGSYGIRQHESVKWVYGTGCAEPRLTQAIRKLRN